MTNSSDGKNNGAGSFAVPGALLPKTPADGRGLSMGGESYDQMDFDSFRQFLKEACGIALGDNKQYLVSNRLRRLMDEHGLTSFSELVRSIRNGGNRRLRDQVIDAMTTNETFWFRDVYPFDQLFKHLLPSLMSPDKRMFGSVRIWCAACSSGQEPYSISMIVEEYKRQNMGALSRPVQIVATDLSNTVLEQARIGSYDRLSILRGLSPERLERFFDPVPNNTWQIKPFIKERVEFRPINLLDSYSGLGRFDIIFCRNVLIYFDADLKRAVLQKLHASLKPGGILFLGSSEGLASATDLFEMVRCDPGILYKAI